MSRNGKLLFKVIRGTTKKKGRISLIYMYTTTVSFCIMFGEEKNERREMLSSQTKCRIELCVKMSYLQSKKIEGFFPNF